MIKASDVQTPPADQARIDTLAAHFVEGSDELCALSDSISEAVRIYVAKDSNRRERAYNDRERVRTGGRL
jgi:hypothetical protein